MGTSWSVTFDHMTAFIPDSKTTIFILSPTNSPGEGLSLSKRQGNVIFSYKFWQSQTVIVYYIVNTIM
jgi:hypothetical protein